MNQTPLTNMEGRYITPATEEAFNALVTIGYKTLREYAVHVQYGAKYLFISRGIIDSVKGRFLGDMKQAYYHNGHFYDEPYEEFTITEEEVPFPELEDIEVYTDGHLSVSFPTSFTDIFIGSQYRIAKQAYENGIEVKWKLKQKIDRRLHKNRPLALSIGKVLDESRTACIDLSDGTFLQYVSSTGEYFMVYSGSGTNVELYDVSACTLPDDYIFPDQVIEWMHEYEKEEQNA